MTARVGRTDLRRRRAAPLLAMFVLVLVCLGSSHAGSHEPYLIQDTHSFGSSWPSYLVGMDGALYFAAAYGIIRDCDL